MLYQAERDHCSKILGKMNSLRDEESCHDVCLIAGDKKLHAHKWVLVAVSDYFRSFFMGPFGDRTTTEIDLSGVTSDSEALELVLNFIYTGAIDINQKHIGSILKIADYFLLNGLKGFCGKFLLDNLTVTNCMMAYVLAIDFSFPEVEKVAELKLRSRMHDFLIYEKSSLEISPEQLLYLVNHEFFEHCSAISILSFVRDWVRMGNSEKHETLGYEILDKLCPEKLPSFTNDKSRMDIVKTLQDVSLQNQNEESAATEFSAKLNSIVTKYTIQANQDGGIENIQGESSKLEQVLITLSPTDKEIEATGKQLHPLPKDSPLFDLCVYVPRTKTWHHVMTVPEKHDFFTELSGGDENWTLICLVDRIIVLCPMSSTVEEYSLRDFKWKSRELGETMLPRDRDYYRIKNLFAEKTGDGNVVSLDEVPDVGYKFHSGSAGMFSIGQTPCLLLKMRINQPGEEPDNPFMRNTHGQAFFKCYKLDSDDEWSFWFDTPKFEADELRWGRARAAVSSDNREMLIVHHDTKKFHVFLADLAEGGTTVVAITPDKSRECKTSFSVTDFHILRTPEGFYVVAVGEQKKGPSKVVCRYKYSFNSKSLTVCDDSESKVLVVDDGGMKYGAWYYPLQFKISESAGASLWLFGGNTYDECFLKEVTVQDDGSLLMQSLPPPPFSRITQAATGCMDVDCLAQIEPQKTYLTEVDMNTFERRPYNLLGRADSDENDDDDAYDEYGSYDEYECHWRNISSDEDYYDEEDDDDEFESDDPDAEE